MSKTVRIKVSTTARRIGNSVRVQQRVSNGTSTRTTSKTIRVK